MQYATENIIPVTLELGGKSPNIFFSSVMDADDAFLDKAIEGAVLFALNQGEICTCPSRLLIQEDIYDKFIAKVIDRVNQIKVGDPLDPSTMMGAQASKIQKDKIMSYIQLGKEEGAEVLTGGDENNVGIGFEEGYYIKPTLFKGNNKMRVFQEYERVMPINFIRFHVQYKRGGFGSINITLIPLGRLLAATNNPVSDGKTTK